MEGFCEDYVRMMMITVVLFKGRCTAMASSRQGAMYIATAVFVRGVTTLVKGGRCARKEGGRRPT